MSMRIVEQKGNMIELVHGWHELGIIKDSISFCCFFIYGNLLVALKFQAFSGWKSTPIPLSCQPIGSFISFFLFRKTNGFIYSLIDPWISLCIHITCACTRAACKWKQRNAKQSRVIQNLRNCLSTVAGLAFWNGIQTVGSQLWTENCLIFSTTMVYHCFSVRHAR